MNCVILTLRNVEYQFDTNTLHNNNITKYSNNTITLC